MRSPFLRRFGMPSPFFDNETGFSPAALFALAEPGIWLDPSDLSTMFQDRAGTTPVTTPGQEVGYRRDKSGNNNHAIATADLNRGIYGIEPLGGRRNLLERTEEFDNAIWVKGVNGTASAPVVTPNAATAPDGTMTADLVQLRLNGATDGSFSWLYQNLSVPSGATRATSVYVKAAIAGDVGKTIRLSGTVVTAVTLTADWQRVSNSALLVTGATISFGVRLRGTDATSDSVDLHIWGGQVDDGATATAYQRVVDQYNVTQAGVPTLHYVQYDGANDTYLTPTITPGTDKVQVFTGMRKLSDATRAVFLEWSPASSNNGTFAVEAPAVATEPRFTFFSRGTLAVSPGVNNAIYAAPITQVMTGLGDISGDVATVRLNGTQVSRVTADQGTGNYLAYPLYIGRRNDASFAFNGRDYGIIVRFGANLTTTQIADTEGWMNQRTGAY